MLNLNKKSQSFFFLFSSRILFFVCNMNVFVISSWKKNTNWRLCANVRCAHLTSPILLLWQLVLLLLSCSYTAVERSSTSWHAFISLNMMKTKKKRIEGKNNPANIYACIHFGLSLDIFLLRYLNLNSNIYFRTPVEIYLRTNAFYFITLTHTHIQAQQQCGKRKQTPFVFVSKI